MAVVELNGYCNLTKNQSPNNRVLGVKLDSQTWVHSQNLDPTEWAAGPFSTYRWTDMQAQFSWLFAAVQAQIQVGLKLLAGH